MDKDQPIGIFDSGVGGLTVVRAIAKLLPNENLIYLGDTARVPYGTKSRETVLKYTIQNTLFLLEKKVKAIVIACNTASAYGLDTVGSHYKVPVIGVIEPGARAAINRTKTKKVGIIGTEGTIRSASYPKALSRLDPSITALSQACPLLVSLAEEGWISGDIVRLVLEKYLKSFKNGKGGIDTLILGCTHYPLFKEAIGTVLGPQVTLIDSAIETAKTLKGILEQYALFRDSSSKGQVDFYSTDSPERMQRIGHYFLGTDIGDVSRIDIGG